MILITALILTAIPISASTNLQVQVNGSMVSFPDARPYIDANNRTLVPVRFIAEELGAQVEWEPVNQMVTVITRESYIELTIGSSHVIVNGEGWNLDTAAVITSERTFVPLRFVSEALGADVHWQGDTRTVVIQTEGQTLFSDLGVSLTYPDKWHYEYLNPASVIFKDPAATDAYDVSVNIQKLDGSNAASAEEVKEAVYNEYYSQLEALKGGISPLEDLEDPPENLKRYPVKIFLADYALDEVEYNVLTLLIDRGDGSVNQFSFTAPIDRFNDYSPLADVIYDSLSIETGAKPAGQPLTDTLRKTTSGGETVLGNLESDGIRIRIPGDAFRQPTELILQAAEPPAVSHSDGHTLVGPSYQFQISGPQKRSDAPMELTMKVNMDQVQQPGRLRVVHDFGERGIKYHRPVALDQSAGTITVELYHNGFIHPRELTLTQLEKEYVDRRARQSWAMEEAKNHINMPVERMVEEILIDGFNANNRSIINSVLYEVMTDITDDKIKHSDLVRTLYEGDYREFSTKIAKLTGKSLAKKIDMEGLNIVFKYADDAGEVAGVFTEEGVDRAAEVLADKIIENVPMLNNLRRGTRVIRTEMNNFQNNEIEEAYQVFIHGGQDNRRFFGLIGYDGIPPGNFEEIWDRMAGVQRRVVIEAEEAYRKEHNLRPMDDIPRHIREDIREQAKIDLRSQFENRRQQEQEIEVFRQQHHYIMQQFSYYDLLSESLMRYHDVKSEEELLDRYYLFLDDILRDTGRKAFGFDRWMISSTEDILKIEDAVFLLAVRTSNTSDAYERYMEHMRRKGLLPEEEKEPETVQPEPTQPEPAQPVPTQPESQPSTTASPCHDRYMEDGDKHAFLECVYGGMSQSQMPDCVAEYFRKGKDLSVFEGIQNLRCKAEVFPIR